MNEENMIKKVLKNEYTQIIFIGGAIMWFVFNVQIPLVEMKLGIADIQVTLSEMKVNNASLDARITQNSNDIITLKEQLRRYNIK